MTIRRLHSLISTAELVKAPSFARASRARGAKREGIKYERDFARSLGPRARHGVWMEFRDSHGPGWAQTDAQLELADVVLVFECKYTWVAEAAEKLAALYCPLVEVMSGKPALGIVVCKRLTRGVDAPICATLADAIAHAPSVLHWLPGTPLVVPATIAPARPRMPLSSRTVSQRGLVPI